LPDGAGAVPPYVSIPTQKFVVGPTAVAHTRKGKKFVFLNAGTSRCFRFIFLEGHQRYIAIAPNPKVHGSCLRPSKTICFVMIVKRCRNSNTISKITSRNFLHRPGNGNDAGGLLVLSGLDILFAIKIC